MRKQASIEGFTLWNYEDASAAKYICSSYFKKYSKAHFLELKNYNPYTNTNKEKIGSFFSRALAYEVNGFPR